MTSSSEAADLVDRLDKALENWDTVYPQMIQDADQRGIKMTEERLRVATRNWMRGDDMEIPEILRWRLRVALREGEDEHD